MVFKKRLDYGFNAFNVRNVPRAPRSIRRWGQSKKTVEESRFCAFELLASLAGKLLQESESSASSNASEGHDHVSVGKNVIKQEIQYEDKLLKTECFEQGGCEVSGVASESTIENSDNLKEFTCAENDAILELTSTKTDPACSGQISGDLKPVICTGNVTYGNFAGNLDRCSPYFGELCDGKTENGFKQQRDPQGSETVASGGGIKPLYCKRKTYYNYDSCQYDTLYKRRKIVDCNSMVTSDGEISGESVTNSPEKVMNEDKISTAAMSNGACRISSVFTGHQASPRHKDSHMKFSIKSFRIPELYIEVPETATIGSLKRTVMEAVTAFLGGGIRVGVLLQGKNVRDDSRTLSQTGISCEDNLDALGFTLEPSPAKAPPSVCLEEPPVLLSCDAAPQNLTSSPDTPAVDTVITDAAPDPPLLTNSEDHVANHEPVSSQTDMLTDQSLSESRALVPVPAMNVEALAAVPANQKIQKSELAQRRTRRPFSVSEVEALVQAVEELGTGRWRDVKLRAFENADYRTYVDLKDKWKTLVHTAEISPQHRRGELVPQQLLDRVLAAHGYWSQHQAKKQGKHHTETLRITDTQADRNGVEAVPTGRM